MAKSQLVGMNAVKAALAKAGRDMVAGADAAVDQAAEEMAADMRARAPRDTGELADGIGVRAGADGSREVGPFGVDHAPFPEFGTSDMPAQPYMTPAAETERQRLPGRVASEVSRRLG